MTWKSGVNLLRPLEPSQSTVWENAVLAAYIYQIDIK